MTPALSNAPGNGGPFTVYVVLEDLHHFSSDRQVVSDGLAAFQVTLGYDPAVLTVVSAELGPDVSRTGRNFQCLPPSRRPEAFSFGCLSLGAQPAGAQGSLTLASVELMPVGPGLSPLTLDAVLAGPLGEPAPVVAVGGAVRVTGTVPATSTPSAATTSPTHTIGAPAGTTKPPAGGSATATTAVTVTPDGTPTPTPASGGGKDSGGSGAAVWWLVAVGGTVATLGLAMGLTLWLRKQRGST